MVGRALLPWSPKRRIGRRDRDGGLGDLGGPSLGDLGGDDPLSIVLGLVALVCFVVVAIVLTGPVFGLLVLGLEWLVVLVGAVIGVALRALLGMPFRVFAVSSDQRYQVDIRGWRLSARVADELAARIKVTGRPPGAAPS